MRIFKYLEHGSVKHEFENEIIREALCGVGATMYLTNYEWKDDKEVLDNLNFCRNCKREWAKRLNEVSK